ncbi:hypothetical protein A2930_04245 [Candidatus Giovannonibacteria bacterium RIFCSPLOWO2_01_FULL_45_34]|uniref:Uncharacterized protein n=1 Tax=Candidatus Giovannonibacteria bacterium RIFCSPLOWO2_01_FULL_45_34 TaxID=1798351 RepID=A0A1F5WZ48_9BACT|nr:MAG: hypothetical protein A2930_04245 [Candidatus Giovannonibacteria bacterium RIFCSPLOWO2_01_FULL_45_34]
MKKLLTIGIVYLIYQFFGFAAPELLQAGDRHYGQRHEQRRVYRPQHRVYAPVPIIVVPRRPVYTPWYPIYGPAPVYQYPHPQVIVRERVVVVERPVIVEREASAPAPQYRSGLFLSGGSPEVQAAVKKELLDKKVLITTDRSSAASELKISEKIIGDPWFRIELELIDLEVNRIVSASDGSYPYKSRSEWGKLEAIREAAHAAVSSLKYL